MKIILVLIFSLMSTATFAREIYAIKDKDGGTILSLMEDTTSGYKHLTIDKEKYMKAPKPEEWSINCSRDRFNGQKICSLYRPYSDLMVNIIDGYYSVYVGGSHFPRSQSAIKIDENKPVYGYEGTSQTPQKVIEQMKNGKVAYTRYKEWPYEYNRDGETDLTGFTEKFNEMLEEYKKL